MSGPREISFWTALRFVSLCLKQHGFTEEAREFRRRAEQLEQTHHAEISELLMLAVEYIEIE